MNEQSTGAHAGRWGLRGTVWANGASLDRPPVRRLSLHDVWEADPRGWRRGQWLPDQGIPGGTRRARNCLPVDRLDPDTC